MAHFVGIVAVNFVLLYEQNSKNTPKSNGYKQILKKILLIYSFYRTGIKNAGL